MRVPGNLIPIRHATPTIQLTTDTTHATLRIPLRRLLS